jgi:hypothetical protein
MDTMVFSETSETRARAAIPGTMVSPRNLDLVLRSKVFLSKTCTPGEQWEWINTINRMTQQLVFFYALYASVGAEEYTSPLKERQERELNRQVGSGELWKRINAIEKTNGKLVWHCCYRDNVIQSFEKKEDVQSYVNTSNLLLTVIGPI